MVDALVVMLETMKLLLFGFAMLFVLTLFLTLMVIIANLHIHLGYQILAMVSLLLLFTGVVIQLMVCANKDNNDNNNDINNNNNNRSNNSSDNLHRVVQITIEDPPPPYFPNSIMNHAFCVESDEELDSEASSECRDISPDEGQNTEYGDHLNPMDYYADGIIDDELCDLDLFDGPFIDSEIRFCDTVYDDGDGSIIGGDDKNEDDCGFNSEYEILI